VSFANAKPFTPEEDAVIRASFGRVQTAVLVRQMGRNHDSLRRRAERLGVVGPDLGAPAGTSREDQAARLATRRLELRLREVAALRGVQLAEPSWRHA
jgi:hypothetical protein